jgi:hypothetical protein
MVVTQSHRYFLLFRPENAFSHVVSSLKFLMTTRMSDGDIDGGIFPSDEHFLAVFFRLVSKL